MYSRLFLIVFLQLFSNIDSNGIPSQKLIRPIRQLLPFLTVKPTLNPQPAYTKCPKVGFENWITFDSKTCYYVSVYAKTWHDANDFCHSNNAQLLSIHDTKTNNLFANFKFNNNYYYYSTYFWIGLNSLSKRGEYKWSDGTPVQFRNYANTTINGQPQSTDIFLQGRCVVLRANPSNNLNYITNPQTIGRWFRDECSRNYGYICQKSLMGPTISPTTPTPPGNCPSDWIQYKNQKCIKILDSGLMTWTEAKARCASITGGLVSGELLSIHSAEEQNFVTSLIADKPMPFIGIKFSTTTYTWVWDDQSPVSYTNWASQINNYNYYANNCTVMVTNDVQAGKWLYTSCKSNHTAICERPKDPNIATPPPKAFQSCSISGFENFVQFRHSCYMLVDDPNSYQTFNDAENSCQKLNGAHLVSIVNPFEYSFLKYYITQNGKSDQYWIGFYSSSYSDVNVSQVFKWTDNWPNYFTQWDDGEPLFSGQADKECVYQFRSNGTWRTSDCVSNRAYICKTTTDTIPKLDDEVTAICPKINSTDKKQQWVDLDKRSKYCYWFSADINNGYSQGLMTWADASFRCRKRNGTLASIHSNHDLSLMKSRLNNKYNTWIGLYKTQNEDFVWEDGSAIDFTNWDENQEIVNIAIPGNDDSGEMCVETKALDLKWRQNRCSGYTSQNLYVCQIQKVFKSSSISYSNESSTGMSGGSKAGIVLGVIILVALVCGCAFFAAKKLKLNPPNFSNFTSFENSLYASRRGQNVRPNGETVTSEPAVSFTKSENSSIP